MKNNKNNRITLRLTNDQYEHVLNSGDISTNQINKVLGGNTNKIKGKS